MLVDRNKGDTMEFLIMLALYALFGRKLWKLFGEWGF